MRCLATRAWLEARAGTAATLAQTWQMLEPQGNQLPVRPAALAATGLLLTLRIILSGEADMEEAALRQAYQEMLELTARPEAGQRQGRRKPPQFMGVVVKADTAAVDLAEPAAAGSSLSLILATVDLHILQKLARREAAGLAELVRRDA